MATDIVERNGESAEKVGLTPVIIGDATLYCGDSLELLAQVGKVDAVITDPPYGVLSESWDDMDKRQLTRFTMAWASRCAMMCETAVVFFGERTRGVASPILEALYEDVRQIIWSKGGGQIAEDRLFYSFESAFYCHQNKVEEFAQPKDMQFALLLTLAREKSGMSRGGVDMAIRGKKTGLCYRWEEGACLPTSEQERALFALLPLGTEASAALGQARAERNAVMGEMLASTKAKGAIATDVLSIPGATDRRHPTEKPVPLMAMMINVVGATSILDPFMGSGTTGVAAIQLGRKFIGIERERKYFDIACRRIEQAVAQGQLFAPEPMKQEQANMFAEAP